MVRPGLNIRNEEWAGSPRASRYGRGFRAGLVARKIVNDPPPLVARNVRDGATGFRDRFGTMVNSTPYPTPLIAMSQLRDYRGQLPLGSLRLMQKPKPWEVR